MLWIFAGCQRDIRLAFAISARIILDYPFQFSSSHNQGTVSEFYKDFSTF